MLEGSILQRLEAAHQTGEAGKRPLSFGVYYKNTLVALCHALEDCILSCSSSPLVVTAFQRGKWYLQEAERYGDLAARSRQVVIMAAPDSGFTEHPTSQRENVAIVGLDPADPVAQEWHLIILAPTYTAMVLCQELSAADYGPGGVPTDDRERKFYGFWTFEPNLVQETVELAIDHLGRYNPELQKTLQAQAAAIANETTQAESDDLCAVVSRVVDYLKASQQDLGQLPFNEALHPDVLDHNLISNELQAFLRIAQLSDLTDIKNPMAAAEVAALAEMMGQLLDLPAWQLHRLRLAGMLHRIAPMQEVEGLSGGPGIQAQEEAPSCPLSCPLVPGAQVLRTLPRLSAIATIINHQTEWWDGSGHPAGLAGDEIPLESRILGLVENFQRRVAELRLAYAQGDGQSDAQSDRALNLEAALSQVLAECQTHQGTRWDPKLVDVLALLVCGLQQGLSLPLTPHRVTSGMWLLDARLEEAAYPLSSGTENSEKTAALGGTHGH
jgi:DICT domain-containing protein